MVTMETKHNVWLLLTILMCISVAIKTEGTKTKPENTDNNNEHADGTLTEAGMSHDDVTDAKETMGPDILLTPSYNMTFGEGETLTVGCGYRTANAPGYIVTWYSPTNEPITNSERYTLVNTTSDEKAFWLNCTINNLTVADTGPYTCSVTQPETETVINAVTNLQVLPIDLWCGFEDDDLCGWSTSKTGGVTWERHGGRLTDEGVTWERHGGRLTDEGVTWERHGGRLTDEETHSALPPTDHTYLSQKQIGHFLDVDVKHGNTENTDTMVARIYSQQYSAFEESRCLQFWYRIKGQDADELNIYVLTQAEHITDATKPLKSLTGRKDTWKQATILIESQLTSFKFGFEAKLCKESCEEGNIAIDDVHFINESCTNNEGDAEPVLPTTTATTTTTTTTTATTTTTSATTSTPLNTTSTAVTTTTKSDPSKTTTTTHKASTTPGGKSTPGSPTSPDTVTSTTTTTTHKPLSNDTSTKRSKDVDVHKGQKIGRGLAIGISVIVILAVAAFALIIYKGRKRRTRKSKYLNFGGPNYSTEHLPTNEFHLESPLTMGSMGYTVLA